MKTKLLLFTLAISFALVGCSSSTTVTTDDGKVKLASYTSLKGTKTITTVTDEDVEAEIESMLSTDAEYKEVKRGVKEGDYVTLYLTATIDDTELYNFSKEDGGFEVVSGDGSFGQEFDDELISKKAGDKYSITITYEEDFDDSDLAGNTVDYEVTVGNVTEEILPDLTDQYVSKNYDFDTVAEFKEAVRTSLEVTNEENSTTALGQDLLSQVVENSTIESYSDELYEEQKAAVESTYQSYMQMFQAESLEDLYTMLNISEDDVEAEIIDSVNAAVVISAIAKKEGLEVTDEEYTTLGEELATSYDYDSLSAMEEDYSEEEIQAILLQEKVYDLLIEHATVTESEQSSDDSAY